MHQLQTLYSCKWDIIMKQNKLIKVWSYSVGRSLQHSRLVLILDIFSSNAALISAITSIFLSLSRRTPWSSRWKSLPIHGYHYTYIIRQPYNLYSWTSSLNIFKNHGISDSYRDRREGGCLLRRCAQDRPDDGESKHLWNVGQILQDYAT
jgi:hypothetical protein